MRSHTSWTWVRTVWSQHTSPTATSCESPSMTTTAPSLRRTSSRRFSSSVGGFYFVRKTKHVLSWKISLLLSNLVKKEDYIWKERSNLINVIKLDKTRFAVDLKWISIKQIICFIETDLVMFCAVSLLGLILFGYVLS